MKTNIIYFLVVLLLASCNHSQETSLAQTNISDPENKVFVKEILNHDQSKHLGFDSLNGYFGKEKKQLSIKFNCDTANYTLSSIIVYEGEKVIQKINVNKEVSTFDFSLTDWNFDGYPDITVLDNCGSGGCAYWIWNYSPAQAKFIYNKELSEKLGLELDTLGKFIIFHYREGFSNEIWDSMQYVNNKLSFIKGVQRERWTDNSGKSWVKRTSTRKINNNLEINIDSAIVTNSP